MDLVEKYKELLGKFDIAGRTIRIALSGGSDSVALTELTLRAQSHEIAAIHVVHGIREAGELDAAFVEKFCRERSIPLEIRRVDAPSFARAKNLGIEEAARKLRYSIFEKFIEGGEIIATGHTANDCVETMLFNLIRGAGPRGLAGIPKIRGGVIRPLLDFWRNDIEKWLESEGISWCEDESNLDLRFSRNRIRWMFLPELKRIFGEGAPERLRREADIFSACSEFIENRGDALAKEALIVRLGNIMAFRTEIAMQTLWGFGEILRFGLRALDIGMSALSFETVKRLEKNIRTARRGRRFPVGEGLHIEIDRETFFLFDNLPDSRIEAPLDTDIELPSGMGVMRISRNNGKNRVPFDGGRLSLRPSAPGDITDSGIKLRRHLMRKGIPHLIRDTAPVLFSGNVPLFFPPVGPLAKNPSLFELFVDYDGPLDILFNRER